MAGIKHEFIPSPINKFSDYFSSQYLLCSTKALTEKADRNQQSIGQEAMDSRCLEDNEST